MRRSAGVDYGRRRIGLAVSDPLGITVRSLPTLHHEGDLAEAARLVAERLAAEDVGPVVVGLPLHADGRPSPMSEEVRRFARLLEAALGREVALFDEGLTSWEAEEALRARGENVRQARRSGAVDAGAAVALLRSWLREQEGDGPPPGPDEGGEGLPRN